MLKDENLIFDERKIKYCTKRIAYQIFESNIQNDEIFLVGISENGSVFAREIERILNSICKLNWSGGFFRGDIGYKVIKK